VEFATTTKSDAYTTKNYKQLSNLARGKHTTSPQLGRRSVGAILTNLRDVKELRYINKNDYQGGSTQERVRR
jgi:hypothetical protein